MSMTSDSLPLSEIDANSCCFGNSLRYNYLYPCIVIILLFIILLLLSCSFDDVDDLVPFIKKHCISYSIDCPGDADPTCLPDYIPEVPLPH